MIEQFKELSQKEIISLAKFTNSPYFNSNKKLIRLVNHFKSLYPDIQDMHLEKKYIMHVVFPSQKHSDASYRTLLSDFTDLFERFLIQYELDKEVIRNKTKLLNTLRRKGLSKRFIHNLKEVRKIQQKKFSKDNSFYENEIEIETDDYYFNINKFRHMRSGELQRKSFNIDLAFIFHKLHCFNEMRHNEYLNDNSFSYEKTFYQEIDNYLRSIESVIAKNHPNVFIISNVLRLHKTSDKKIIDTLLKYIEDNINKFTKEKISYYYNYLLTYISERINKGEYEYRLTAMTIFKKMMPYDMFLTDNVFDHNDFNAVVNMVLPLKEYKWLNNFIEKYKNKIEKGFAKDAYSLALAKLHFNRKLFDKVYPLLNEVEYKTPEYYVNSKLMMARLLYETGKFDSIDYIIKNLRQYIRLRNEVTGDQIEIVRTFIRYLSALLKLSESKSKSDVILLKKELENEKKFVSNKNWFFEKIETQNI